MRNAATAPTASQISCLCQIVATNVGTSVCPAEYSAARDRKSTRLNSSHSQISYAVFCLKKKTAPPPTTDVAPREITEAPNLYVQNEIALLATIQSTRLRLTSSLLYLGYIESSSTDTYS